VWVRLGAQRIRQGTSKVALRAKGNEAQLGLPRLAVVRALPRVQEFWKCWASKMSPFPSSMGCTVAFVFPEQHYRQGTTRQAASHPTHTFSVNIFSNTPYTRNKQYSEGCVALQ